jgi:site-specific DNA-methyltransferase (adenine-specific)
MKYSILYCDPPWEYENPKDHKSEYGGTPYKQISLKDLKKLPIKDLAEKDSILFLWATMPKLPEAIALMKSWNFRFTCVPFVWVKLNPKGEVEALDLPEEKKKTMKTLVLHGGLYSGIGHWTAGNAEIVLMGKRGSLKRITKEIKQVVIAPRSHHSHKPSEVRERIVRLLGDVPRIELFATEKADGWDAIGGALDGMDITESLQKVIDK